MSLAARPTCSCARGRAGSSSKKLTASDATFNFGEDVAISGDRIVVGALSQGVYVFERLGAHWDEQAKILNPQPYIGDAFGDCVAVSGDTILVGDERNFGLKGAAYVFVKMGDGWIQEAKLVLPDPASGDFFGYSVALSGDTALVGAVSDDIVNGSLDEEGTATVFVRQAGIWTEQQLLALHRWR